MKADAHKLVIMQRCDKLIGAVYSEESAERSCARVQQNLCGIEHADVWRKHIVGGGNSFMSLELSTRNMKNHHDILALLPHHT